MRTATRPTPLFPPLPAKRRYLVKQLRGYKDQTRADADGAMTMAAQPLTAADIDRVAHYIIDRATTPPIR